MKPDATLYVGRRLPDPGERPSSVTDCEVTVDNRTLFPERSLRLRNHSPDGFNWGYGGSGPAQLALAILLDFTGDPELALWHYHDFKFRVIATIPQEDGWTLSGERVRLWIQALDRERPLRPEAVETEL